MKLKTTGHFSILDTIEWQNLVSNQEACRSRSLALNHVEFLHLPSAHLASREIIDW